MKEQEKELIPLLHEAAQRWLAFGHQDIWSSDFYTDELGNFCNEAADKITKNAITDDEKKKLYFIFAPTCEWDDSVGDADFGNKIFECINALYRDVALTD
jgi:hypothetical protein